ncbi:MAG TPA: hypothetical protein VJA21_27830, partial [Verrucomicrobiae bacterium]
NLGYAFVNWTDGATEVSTAASYSFTASANRTLVANFILTYAISLSASPTTGGSVTGGGTYNSGSNVTVVATANLGYTFVNWTDGATEVSTSASYGFTVTANRTLVANFTPFLTIMLSSTNTAIVSWPTGSGFVLQENSAVGNGAGWIDNTDTVEASGGVNRVILSPSGTRFFRLFRQ